MKKTLAIPLLTIFILLASCTPADYCDTINVEIKKCQISVHTFLNTKSSRNPNCDNVMEQLLSSEKKIRKLGYFREEKVLFDSALAIINFYKTALSEVKDNNTHLSSDFLLNFKETEEILISLFKKANHEFIIKFDLIQTQL